MRISLGASLAGADEAWSQGDLRAAYARFSRLLRKNPFEPATVVSYIVLSAILGKQRNAARALDRYARMNRNDSFYSIMSLRTEAILGGIKTIGRYGRFVFIHDTDAKSAIGRIAAECGTLLSRIETLTGRVFSEPYIIVDLDGAYFPISTTDTVFSPGVPLIMMSEQNCETGILAHEITHAVFPTRNTFLAEALALHLQAVLAGLGDWPFRDPSFCNSGAYPLEDLLRETIWELDLFARRKIATGDATAAYRASYDFIEWFLGRASLGSFLEVYGSFANGLGITTDLREAIREHLLLRLSDYAFGAADRPEAAIDNAGENDGSSSPVTEMVCQDADGERVTYLDLAERYDRVKYTKDEIELRGLLSLAVSISHPEDLQSSILVLRILLSLMYLRFNASANGRVDSGDGVQYGEQANDLIGRCIERWPENSNLRVLHAEIIAMRIANAPEYARLKLAIKMQTEINKAIDLDERNVDAYVSMVKILCNTPKVFGGGIAAARKCLAQARKIEPSNIDLESLDAHLDYLDGKKELAAVKWKQVLSARPDHSFSLSMLEQCAARDGA